MSLLDSFPHTVDLARVTYTADPLGGDVPSENPTPYAEAESAWVQPASANTIREFQQRNQQVSHTVYLRRNPGLKLDDVMTVHGGPYDGAVLAIVSFNETTAGLGLAWQAICQISREP